MIFIKVPSKAKDETDFQLENLGVATQGISVYLYINVTNWNVFPIIDDDGTLVENQCYLMDKQGIKSLSLDMSPEDYIKSIGGVCINKNNEVD